MKLLKKLQKLKDNKLILLILIILSTHLLRNAFFIHLKHYKLTPLYLIPFAPLCDLIALLFLACFLIYFFKKRIPAFLAAFTFFTALSYAIMSLIFYPAFISWYGLTFGKAGAFFWVVFFGFLAFVISDQLKRIQIWKYSLIVFYFAAKDFFDYILDNAYYFRIYAPPLWLKQLSLILIPIQIFVFILMLKMSKKIKKKK